MVGIAVRFCESCDNREMVRCVRPALTAWEAEFRPCANASFNREFCAYSGVLGNMCKASL